MPLKASFFFFLTTLSAISCGFLAARLSFSGSGIELAATETQSITGGGGHWLHDRCHDRSALVSSDLDMFRTVVNVFGDSLCCLFLNDTDGEEETVGAPIAP